MWLESQKANEAIEKRAVQCKRIVLNFYPAVWLTCYLSNWVSMTLNATCHAIAFNFAPKQNLGHSWSMMWWNQANNNLRYCASLLPTASFQHTSCRIKASRRKLCPQDQCFQNLFLGDGRPRPKVQIGGLICPLSRILSVSMARKIAKEMKTIDSANPDWHVARWVLMRFCGNVGVIPIWTRCAYNPCSNMKIKWN